MLILNTTTTVLRVLSSTTADLDVSASWADMVIATKVITPDATDTKINTIATTTVVAAPSTSGERRTVENLIITNVHATNPNTVTLQRYNGTNAYQIAKVTLTAGERLQVGADGVPRVYDASGVEKSRYSNIDPMTNGYRITGVTLDPVMTVNSSSLSTVYLTPFRGAAIALWNASGEVWEEWRPGEVSLAVTGRTTDLPFDVFACVTSGAVVLEFVNWTNATTRATGISRTDGVWTKTGDQTRRYVGSVRARSATTFHWVLTGDDTPIKMDIWNVDNKVEVGFCLRALTNTWAYTLATWRQAQASANYQIDIMVGLEQEMFNATLMCSSRNSTISIPRHVGIGFDSTTAISAQCVTSATANTVASIECDQSAQLAHVPVIGRHFYAWLEISTATGTCTWVGDDGALRLQSGMVGTWVC